MNNAENHIADVTEYMQAVGERARAASRLINRASTAQKNAALLAIADSLDIRRDQLIMANQKDLDAGRGKNLDSPNGPAGTYAAENRCDGRWPASGCGPGRPGGCRD